MGSEIVKAWNAEKRDDMLWVDPERVVLVTDKTHALHDVRATDKIEETLVQNVIAFGVRVPILLARDGKDEEGNPIVEVVDGRRRVLAAREANRRLGRTPDSKDYIRIPAVRQQGDDAELASVMVLTNAQRKQVDPLRDAENARKLKALGKTDGEIAVIHGVSLDIVRKWQALDSLSPAAKDAVRKGDISPTAALKLKDVPRAEQAETLPGIAGAKSQVKAAEKIVGPKRGRRAGRIRSRKLVVALREKIAQADIEKRHEIDAVVIIDWLLGNDDALPKWLREEQKTKKRVLAQL